MLPFLPLRLHYTATARMPVPRYTGSMWRSGFGAQLRELACVTGAPVCGGCPVRHNCAYGLVFDTVRPPTAQGRSARHQEQPHPYLLSPVAHDEQSASVDFTVLGPAMDHLPLLLRALKRHQPSRKHGGQWQLSAITLRSPGADTADAPVWNAGEPWPRFSVQQIAAPRPPLFTRVILEHPLRLRVQGQYVTAADFSFTTFFTALLRRLDLLAGLLPRDQTQALDFPGLLEAARALTMQQIDLQWQDWSRYSSRQKQTIPMGGLLGSFELHGDLAAVWPFLWLGQWLHVGKGAVMGLGRYRLESA